MLLLSIRARGLSGHSWKATEEIRNIIFYHSVVFWIHQVNEYRMHTSGRCDWNWYTKGNKWATSLAGHPTVGGYPWRRSKVFKWQWTQRWQTSRDRQPEKRQAEAGLWCCAAQLFPSCWQACQPRSKLSCLCMALWMKNLLCLLCSTGLTLFLSQGKLCGVKLYISFK